MGNEKKYMDNPVLDTEVELRKIINSGYRFHKTVVLEALKAGTPIDILTEAVVEELTKSLNFSGIYIEGFKFNVDGGTAWVGLTAVDIKDTDDNVLVTIALAQLAGNAFVTETGTVTLSDTYEKGALIADKKGLKVLADSNGSAGSNLVVQVWGRIQ